MMALSGYKESIANKNTRCEVCNKLIKTGDKYYKTYKNVPLLKKIEDRVSTKREYAICIKCKQ
jgi:hypothetical protein